MSLRTDQRAATGGLRNGGVGASASLVNVVGRLREPAVRRIVYVIAAAILLVLTVFPLHYEARTKLLPQDENNSGLAASLGAFGGGLQNFASLIGTHQTTEVYLILGRSNDVALEVVKRMGLLGQPGFANLDQARITLQHRLDIRSLTGGVLELVAKDHSPTFAKRLVATYSDVIQQRARELSREQTSKKKEVISARYKDAVVSLAQAEATLDAFRRENKLAEPQSQFGVAVGLKASLQGQLQGKLVQLQSARQFMAPNNIQIQQIQAEIASLRSQIAQADAAHPAGESNLTGLAAKADQYYDLYRNEQFQQALVQTYQRALEQVAIEEVSTDTGNNIEMIESPYLVPGMRFNVAAVALLLALVLLAVFTEFYMPLTGLGRTRRQPAL